MQQKKIPIINEKFDLPVFLHIIKRSLILIGIIYVILFGIFLTGLGFANIFPLIFSITIDRMPEHTNELSGLMVSSIAGGAFIPLLAGLVADATSSVQIAFIVPILCIIYLLFVAIINNRIHAKECKPN